MRKELIIKIWDRYNHLLIVKELSPVITTQKIRRFECKCDCWNTINVQLNNLRSNQTKSCWCLRVKNSWWITHSMSRSKIYHCWSNMKDRCINSKNKRWKHYWGRWITYDKKWEAFEWFYEDMWNDYNKWLTLDRRDNDWIYNKENCRWITNDRQQRNKSNNRIYKWKCITEWCEELWLNRNTIYSRINISWKTIKEALWL